MSNQQKQRQDYIRKHNLHGVVDQHQPRGAGHGRQIGLERVGQHRREGFAQLLQRLGREFLDEQFNEKILGAHAAASPAQAAAFLSALISRMASVKAAMNAA